MYEFTCVRVYLGIDIHKITLSTLVGYHIGYLVDLASFLCLSFLFSFLFSFAYEYAKLSKCMYMSTDNLLSSLPTSLTTDKRSFDHRQCRFSSPLCSSPKREFHTKYGHVMFSIRIDTTKDHNPWIDECINISAKSIKISLSLIDAINH